MFVVSSLIRKIQSFRQDQQGMVAAIFVLAILPVMMTIGIAVDHSGAQRARNKLQSAADAAVLAAVTTAQKRDEILGNSNSGLHATAHHEAEEQAKAVFLNAIVGDLDILDAALKITVSKDATVVSKPASTGGTYSAVATYTGQYKLMMPNPIGQAALDLSGRSESSLATSGQSGYMQITTLLDTSASMGIGASPADIQILNNRTGCAFTCHHGEPTYGAVLRIDVLRNAVGTMISEAQASVGPDNVKRIQIALNRFEGNQHRIQPMTDDYSQLASKVRQIKINQDGTESSNIGGAMDWITPTITQSGDGKTAENPRKFVFLVTDGMENRKHHWRARNFLAPFASNGNVGSLDPEKCAALKAKGVTVAVLYTTYVGEVAAIPSIPGVSPRLQQCASPGFFFEASTGAQMLTEFRNMFKKATSTAGVRLTK